MIKPVPNKIAYIDNLRVILTALVVMHHTLIAYGAPGSWYFTDKTTSETASIIMTLVVATNQAFFMGFFFLLAALFTEPSYNKKGAKNFIADRLKRLGIPLLFYSCVLSPFMNFLVYKFGYHQPAGFIQYLGGYDDWIDFGVLWFVAALLLFTFIFVIVKRFNKIEQHNNFPLPRNAVIAWFAIALGIITFIVRIFFPVGWVLHPVGFQLAHFTQYIALFTTGIVASRNQWLQQIDFNTGKRWLIVALVLIFSVFPLVFAVKIILNIPLTAFQGGFNVLSLLTSLWEQATGIAIIMALLGICSKTFNYTTTLLQRLARAAFATYIFHPLTVITITLLLLQWHIEPVLKALVAVPAAIITSFCVGIIITKLPVAKNIV